MINLFKNESELEKSLVKPIKQEIIIRKEDFKTMLTFDISSLDYILFIEMKRITGNATCMSEILKDRIKHKYNSLFNRCDELYNDTQFHEVYNILENEINAKISEEIEKLV